MKNISVKKGKEEWHAQVEGMWFCESKELDGMYCADTVVGVTVWDEESVCGGYITMQDLMRFTIGPIDCLAQYLRSL